MSMNKPRWRREFRNECARMRVKLASPLTNPLGLKWFEVVSVLLNETRVVLRSPLDAVAYCYRDVTAEMVVPSRPLLSWPTIGRPSDSPMSGWGKYAVFPEDGGPAKYIAPKDGP